INKNTTCLAFAAKCGAFGASGCVGSSAGAAVALASKKSLRESKSINASPANPPPTCQRNSRRVRRHGVRFGMKREWLIVPSKSFFAQSSSTAVHGYPFEPHAVVHILCLQSTLRKDF